MGFWVRHLAEGRALRNGRWIWLACAVFALVAVLSARGYDTELQPHPMELPKTPYYMGEDVLGTRGVDELRGTAEDERLFSFGGADTVYGGGGSDLIDAGNADDAVFAGPGNDRVRALDSTRDVIDCGAGLDHAYVDAVDLTTGCEEAFLSPDYSLPATPTPP